MSDPRLSRRTETWAASLALATAVAAPLLGCKNETKASAEPATAQAAQPAKPAGEPSAAAPEAKEAKQQYAENSFALKIEPVGDYKAGQEGKAQIELLAKNGYKCNDKYPYKFKLKEAEGIEYPSDVVKKDALELEKKRAVMTVAFTPKTAGQKTVSGQFAFSVCTEERCLVERRDLALDIDVAE